MVVSTSRNAVQIAGRAHTKKMKTSPVLSKAGCSSHPGRPKYRIDQAIPDAIENSASFVLPELKAIL